MKRFHLFEIEDQPWLPSLIKNGITNFLQFIVNKFDLYRKISTKLEYALKITSATKVVDLGSGGGGPWPKLVHHISLIKNHNVVVKLTDLYINMPAFLQQKEYSIGCISYYSSPVNALDVPIQLKGFRTFFSAFHHFEPAKAQAILQDALDKDQGIAIFESTQRHPLLFIYMLITPLLVMATFPFQRPFKWSQLLLTYMLPAIPFCVMFDGLVSCLRTYTPKELELLIKNAKGHERYHWEVGLEKMGKLPIGITYLIGYKTD